VSYIGHHELAGPLTAAFFIFQLLELVILVNYFPDAPTDFAERVAHARAKLEKCPGSRFRLGAVEPGDFYKTICVSDTQRNPK
jgi:hypothetical protein